MNERIKELAEQAGFQSIVRGDHIVFDISTKENLKEFAELIVAECITTILKESKWYWDKDEFESANAVQNAARRVKEHFGVEE